MISRDFAIATTENAGEVQAVGRKRHQIAVVVEVHVHDGAVMLAAGDQHYGLPVIEEIVRIPGVKTDGFRRQHDRA
jgi:hypothetical protein